MLVHNRLVNVKFKSDLSMFSSKRLFDVQYFDVQYFDALKNKVEVNKIGVVIVPFFLLLRNGKKYFFTTELG